MLPEELVAVAGRLPSGVAPEPAPIARPPVLPDGAALAYVDMSGRVGMLELPGDRPLPRASQR